jgi:serine O-acetyltransferase
MIRSKADYKYYLQQDRIALGIPIKPTFKFLVKEFFFPNLIWKYERLLRKLEYLTNVSRKRILSRLSTKIAYRKLSVKLGFSIPINCFDSGLSIAHYGTIVINSETKVGKNCRLHANVNIGASAGKRIAPKLGNNIYIGPGAILFGDIQITDDNVTIGANATVNKDCTEKDVVLAGTPATIVKRNYPVWWKNNKINLE